MEGWSHDWDRGNEFRVEVEGARCQGQSVMHHAFGQAAGGRWQARLPNKVVCASEKYEEASKWCVEQGAAVEG